MTSVFSEVPLALYTRLFQHAQQSTKKEKEQSEYSNNKALAVLLLGVANFCLMLVVNNRRLSNPTTNLIKPQNIEEKFSDY